MGYFGLEPFDDQFMLILHAEAANHLFVFIVRLSLDRKAKKNFAQAKSPYLQHYLSLSLKPTKFLLSSLLI